jgi:simple sugar transport system ATP-binding protein
VEEKPMGAANDTAQNIELAVDMRNISKVYPNGIAANQNVNFSVRKGEIHALIGENGAGKSTLVKMLFGMEQPTAGEILLNGKEVQLASPAQAIEHGIGMVHQHLMLVPSLTVAENMVLGMPPKKGIAIDYQAAVRMTTEIAERYNFKIDAEKRVMDIPVGMKQKIEILKALLRGAEILILDEPTAVLTSNETVELFQQLRNLRDDGFTIIFISHRLNEIKELTDRMTIMRGGRFMGVHNTAAITEQEISRLMVGRDVLLELEKDEADPREVVLSVENVSYTNEWNKLMLDNVSFDVRAGEIVFGLRNAHTGEVKVNNASILGKSQRVIREMGVSLIPEDRMLYGIAASGSITDNILADRYANKEYNVGPFFRAKKIQKDTEQLIKEYRIVAKNQSQQVDMLSGGNIQKVVVAREFSSRPHLIIADQPTRGIDVGATEFIRKRLLDLSREGAAVLLVSADLSEVMEMSDRLLIFYGGEIVASFDDTSTLTDEVMGEYMLGLRRQEKKELEELAYV